jgi:hypothetical protein
MGGIPPPIMETPRHMPWARRSVQNMTPGHACSRADLLAFLSPLWDTSASHMHFNLPIGGMHVCFNLKVPERHLYHMCTADVPPSSMAI